MAINVCRDQIDGDTQLYINHKDVLNKKKEEIVNFVEYSTIYMRNPQRANPFHLVRIIVINHMRYLPLQHIYLYAFILFDSLPHSMLKPNPASIYYTPLIQRDS